MREYKEDYEITRFCLAIAMIIILSFVGLCYAVKKDYEKQIWKLKVENSDLKERIDMLERGKK